MRRLTVERAAMEAVLRQVAAGTLAPEDAAQALAGSSTADLGFATLDLERAERCGFPEVIFGQGKTPAQLAAIFARLAETGKGCLATRVEPTAAAAALAQVSNATHDELARTLWLPPVTPVAPGGKVGIVTAGTSDLPVAREALAAAVAWGCEASLVVDVGVAGLHRLLRRLPQLRAQDVLVVVAGMEGALPSVVGGLVACPVLAVPTSVGYGAHLGGLAPLLTMLNSCASNVAVVNIDAGFNAGHLAGLIARRAVGGAR